MTEEWVAPERRGRPPSGRQAVEQEPESVKIGIRLRHARLVKGYLLRDVAELVGCSVSLLSKFENDRATPSLTMLHRLTTVLGINIAALFDRETSFDGVVMAQGSRPVIDIQDGNGQQGAIRLERLIPYREGHLLQASIHIVAPGADSEGCISHEGEEVGYVLEGRLELTVEQETFQIGTGDSFVFNSDRSHSYSNPGPGVARVLWVNTPPTF